MNESDSLKKLARNFVIPVGSQVVLKVNKRVSARENQADTRQEFRKTGTVGVVVQSPAHNEAAYLVQFSDGSTIAATFDELALRREEVTQLLSHDQYDYHPHVIYRVQVGSKAFGLSTEDSDDDLRGIFLPPAERHWSLYPVPEQIELLDGRDEVYWELEKFLQLALRANPNILETLWSPILLECHPIATELREMRQAFLSKHVYKTYSGYVLSQFRRMKNSFEKTGKYKSKHAMHLLRLIHSGIDVLRTGEIRIDMSSQRDSLLAVRRGEFSLEEVRQQALALDREFQAAFEKTELPEHPDLERVNEFLIRARRSMVQENHGPARN